MKQIRKPIHRCGYDCPHFKGASNNHFSVDVCVATRQIIQLELPTDAPKKLEEFPEFCILEEFESK